MVRVTEGASCGKPLLSTVAISFTWRSTFRGERRSLRRCSRFVGEAGGRLERGGRPSEVLSPGFQGLQRETETNKQTDVR